jgi:formylglycine-generating enzyme required for sulfatase activity
MQGNVWEWVLDNYGHYKKCDDDGICIDPVSLSYGSLRVVRGGGWDDNSAAIRITTDRRKKESEYCYFTLGFRLVRQFR